MGVYVVITPDAFLPRFLESGTGGFFKGTDPNVAISVLKSHWVEGVRVLNIGKAGGISSKSSLRKRIRQYLKFGQGKAIGHRGGRHIWQLEGSASLLIAWKTTTREPRDVERELISAFRVRHGRRPFANLID